MATVRAENASLWGVNARLFRACATASLNVVNGGEAYQNPDTLSVRRCARGHLGRHRWRAALPPNRGKTVNALYQFRILGSPRSKRWYLTRRMAEEDSVACCSHQELTDPTNKDARSIYLSTVFLANRARGPVQPRWPMADAGRARARLRGGAQFWADGRYGGGFTCSTTPSSSR